MTTIGQYRLLERIGEGGMGAVYRGEDVMLQRQVAIKVLRPELASQAALVERFRTEAVALARLNHPNIASVYGLLQHEGQYYMVLEFIDGQTLELLLRRRGALPWREAVQAAKDTLAALDHAHRMGVIHRDLKPANLMLNAQGQLKVMDFGIARLAGTSRHTEYGRIVGTPLYMSPEQLRGEDVDGRSDVYSLGVVLYELLTGKEAFEADSDYALLMAQLNQMPTPVSRLVPGIPRALEKLLERALEKDRGRRFKSATEFRRALTELVPEPVARPSSELIAPDQSVKATRIAGESDRPLAAIAKAGAAIQSLGRPVGQHVKSLTDKLVGASNRVLIGGFGAAVLALLAWALWPSGRPAVEPGMPEVVAAAPSPEPAQTPSQTIASQPSSVPVSARPAPPPPPPANYGEIVTAPPPATPRQRTPATPPESRDTPPSPAPAPPSPQPVENTSAPAAAAVDLSSAAPAFQAGFRQVADWLKARDVGAVERSFGGESAQQEALLKLVRQFPIEIEKDALTASRASGAGRATAEFSATLRWRSSFGNTRRVPVRIIASYAADGSGWRLRSWRFDGNPKLD